MIKQTVEATAAPPPADIRWNRWDQLALPDHESWTPTRSVTVVIPHYRAHDELALVLTALANQSYPARLLQVIVVDDGSPTAPTVPEHVQACLDARVIVQERRNFGAPRARNRGVAEADGEIIIFLDADMVPVKGHVAAHARWHHVAADATVIGFRRHVPKFEGSVEELGTAVRADGLETLFETGPVQVPSYIEGHMRRTGDLRSRHSDLFRVVAGGNLSVRRSTFLRVGGFDESFDRWGGEDTELGYRLFTDGGPLVPDRNALCWHQGLWEDGPDANETRSLHVQRARLAQLIADPGFRSTAPGRAHVVPRCVIRIEVDDTPSEQVVRCAESFLGGHFSDVLVMVDVPKEHKERLWLELQLGGDRRVEVGPPNRPTPPATAVLQTTARITVGPSTVADLIETLTDRDDPVGFVAVTHPHFPVGERVLHVWTTRALGRATRVRPEDPVAAAREQFGARYLSAATAGLTIEGGQARTAADNEPSTITPDVISFARLVDDVPFTVRHRALRLGLRLVAVDRALTALRRARSLSDLRISLASLARAILPARVVTRLRKRLG